MASLQAELAMVQTQLINSRYAVANALHHHVPESQPPLSHHQSTSIPVIQQPAYSNKSSASTTNLINGITNSFSNPNCYSNNNFTVGENDDNDNAAADNTKKAESSGHLGVFSRSSQNEEDDEEESLNGLTASERTVKMLQAGRTRKLSHSLYI